ncbi:uncharacterized protein RHOBADRAFT_55271 [Rhodotorula graminis WP1]|uniref:Uncharacterized protein n=1 Tax=Rhodotorula graminis (strain WP1) TaxID=578459 RepID=A0A0N8PZR1_RHOGW|nr:uncharacterized protein RHOBADRAFT_55271 [Rhodotorula graminis WP1]KPV73029.1 hypothetical protein RHOBADRAFT_55271 [Rhodotorula graminis WP1]
MLRTQLCRTTALLAPRTVPTVRALATSVSSVPPSNTSAPPHPHDHKPAQSTVESPNTTADALYTDHGPSASTTTATADPFPVPLASAASAAPTPTATSTPPPGQFRTTSNDPAPAPAPAPAPEPDRLEPEPLPEPPAPAPLARVRKPVGAFRGGLIGFLLGLTTIGGYGYFRLLDDYHNASTTLLASVEELKGSTQQMATHLSRIAALEDSHAQLSNSAASTKDVQALRAEYRKLLDSEHVDLLSLRAHVWGLEQDLKNLTRRDTSVRV